MLSYSLTGDSKLRHRRKAAAEHSRDLAAVSGRTVSKQTVYSRIAETVLYTRRPVCDELKCTRQSGSDRVFTLRENGARFNPLTEQKSAEWWNE
ncbi:hypothetical protein TNCV_709111 [Trichonephila clavipes]|nr:hypothetical protein TNCV_709111 [Trichonephila clavipes]